MNNLEIRIYYEDTDCGGVVYHSNYLKYMERSRTELLRSIGLDLAHYHTKGLLWAITEVNIKYRFPARYDDLLTVTSTIVEVTSYRVEFKTEIYNQNGVLCAHGDVKMVGFYAETGKVARFPDEIIEKLEIHCTGGKSGRK